MKRFPAYLSALVLCISCIGNDLPVKVVKGAFVNLEIEGALEVDVDNVSNSVQVVLGEDVDMRDVLVKSVSYLNEGTSSVPEIVGRHDLTSPLLITLKTYQDYSWKISATQVVDREFTVKGQLGATVIDEVNRRAIVYVSNMTDLAEIDVTSLKLGPRDVSTYSLEMQDIHDFSEGVEIEVEYRGKKEKWTLWVEQRDLVVNIESVNPWTGCAWLTASAPLEARNGFRYRQAGAEDWIEIEDVVYDGGVYTALVDSLAPLTQYECVAFSDENLSDVVTFETEGEAQIPNGGFDVFSNAESSVYKSWFDPGSSDVSARTKWWDSGNVGSTTVGSSYSIALPDSEEKVEGESSALLVSRNVIVKFAAGNTFSGEFAGLVGTRGGIVNFGRPWTLRPRALSVWVKYEPGVVDVVDSFPEGETVEIGDMDQCSIWMALGNWDYHKYGGTENCPVQINTTDRTTFFRPDDEAVIAYGSFCSDSPSSDWGDRPEVVEVREDGWARLLLPLDYHTVSRVPTHIIISFASSKYGDYFTGSSSSRLHVDDVTLVY